MGESGGRKLAQSLQALREALGNYYGALNQLRMGLKVSVPEKPKALIRYEQCQELGTTFVGGGIVDQPYLWMQEYKIVSDMVDLQESQREAAEGD